MVLKAGWLNRQFDEVSKSVETWPDWMKRAAGIEPTQRVTISEPQRGPRLEETRSEQQRLKL